MRPPVRPSNRRSTRRSFLRVTGLGLVGAAGCLSGGSETTPTRLPTASPTPTEPQEGSETYGPTDGPDERPTKTPPGKPALDPSGSWPQYRLDAGNTGFDPDASGLRDGTGYWTLDAGQTPSALDGTLYNIRARENPSTFARRDPATAVVRSRTDLVSYAVNNPPAVVDGRAFVTTFSEVLCLAADRDEVLWRGPQTRGIQGAPTVTDDALLVNCGGFEETTPRLTAFDFDGTERWSYGFDADSNSVPAVGDDAVFVVTEDDLRAVELETGEERFVTDAVRNRWGTVAVANGMAYVYGYAAEGDETRLYALDAGDGSVRWKTGELEYRPEAPVVADGVVYTPGPDGAMLALDAEDGTETRDFNRYVEPVCRAGEVLYARRRGTLHALDATTGNGLWSYSTPEVQIADTTQRGVYGVTPVDGAVYVDAADGLHGVGPTE